LGGDLFAIVWDAKARSLHGLNASGRSPRSLDYETLIERPGTLPVDDIPYNTALSVSVPGAVDGWSTPHERFGRLSFSDLFAPAIDYAERGVPVSPVIAGQWGQAVARISPDAPGEFHSLYTQNGWTPVTGALFVNRALARSYKLLAEQRRNGFYKGELAERIDGFMQENAGFINKDDFASHTSDRVESVSVNYRGYDVFELPPNGQGMAVLQMLKMLEDDDIAAMGFMSVDCLHLMIEAKKLVFEDRAKCYADMAFTEVPLARLFSGGYKKRRGLIRDNAAAEVEPGDTILRGGDTVYLTTADKEGNMVSLIQSMYYPFGSGLIVPGTGFALQNRGMLFSTDRAHANFYAPGRRPFHTLIPAFVMKEDKPFMSFGVMGGHMQPQGYLQVLTNIIDFNMDTQQAGDAPRWRHDGSSESVHDTHTHLLDGGIVLVEEGFPGQVMKELTGRGHKVARSADGFGGYQSIMQTEAGVYVGASESRKDGQAAGY